jgi:hypothetical protein
MYLKFDIGGICGSLVLCNMYVHVHPRPWYFNISGGKESIFHLPFMQGLCTCTNMMIRAGTTTVVLPGYPGTVGSNLGSSSWSSNGKPRHRHRAATPRDPKPASSYLITITCSITVRSQRERG